jgi:hypothetical protein
MKSTPLPLLLLITVLGLASAARAEMLTLTDKQGRSIQADVISVENETAKIKRSDGQTFDLPLANLSDDNQARLRAWVKPAATEDKKTEESALTPSSLLITASRGKFSSDNLFVTGTYKHTHEQWGYSLQVSNATLKPVDDIRIEYNLFGSTFADLPSAITRTGRIPVGRLTARSASTPVRTQSVEVCKRRSAEYGNSGGEMRGIWIRVYVADQLLVEQVTPPSLKTTEKWRNPENAE